MLLIASPVLAQDTTLQAPVLRYSHSIVTGSPTAISQDRAGHVYLLDKGLNLLRLDPLGRPLDTYSPPARGRFTSIHAWNPMKILLFYGDRQELLLLDRFLRPISSTRLAGINYTGTAKAAALAADDGFWLFDETTLTLSKLDPRLREITIETPLNLILDRERFDVRMLREYQNMVYLLDYNGGIYVFDNLGNYKEKLPLEGLSYIGFRNDELYFVKAGKLHFHQLYKPQTRTLALPPQKPYVAALAGEGHLFLFTPQEVEVYTWQ